LLNNIKKLQQKCKPKNEGTYPLGTERLTAWWENANFAINLFLKYIIIKSPGHLAPLQVPFWRHKTGLGLAFGRFRQSHWLFPLVRLNQKLANSLSHMATYRTVAPELGSADARKT